MIISVLQLSKFRYKAVGLMQGTLENENNITRNSNEKITNFSSYIYFYLM